MTQDLKDMCIISKMLLKTLLNGYDFTLSPDDARESNQALAQGLSGWRLVPFDPTEYMGSRGTLLRGIQDNAGYADTVAIYREMLSAAPNPLKGGE